MDLLNQCHILKQQVEDMAEENSDLTEENRRLRACFDTEQRLRLELLFGLVKPDKKVTPAHTAGNAKH